MICEVKESLEDPIVQRLLVSIKTPSRPVISREDGWGRSLSHSPVN
jgi:hypothetical protein